MAKRLHQFGNRRKQDDKGIFKPSNFRVKVKLDPTGELFPFKVYNELKVKELKSQLEFVTGIPLHLQRVWYLDEAELQEEKELGQYHLVPDAMIHVNVRHDWWKLIQAVVLNDLEEVFRLGVTTGSDFTSPQIDFLAQKNPLAKKQCFLERSFVALFIATHRGHLNLCTKLLDSGSKVNTTTSCGRTALHVAAARGHGNVMDELLEHGAKATKVDIYDDTPSKIALKFGHKECDRHLFMFKWRQRTKRSKSKKIIS